MKTTKKRLLLGIVGAAMLYTGAVFTTLAATAEPQITDETMLANIEALSSGEGGSGPGAGSYDLYSTNILCTTYNSTTGQTLYGEQVDCRSGGSFKCVDCWTSS